jgi:hypothetical protein
MNAIAASPWNEKESGLLAPMSLAGTKWTVENPEKRALGEWVEFGRKLQSASDEEILSLIRSVVTYIEDRLDEETFPKLDEETFTSTYPSYKEYVRGYANTILNAARAELRKRNLKQLR